MDKSQIEELRKLKTLLNEGVLSKEEFIEARDNLLQSGKKETVSNSPEETIVNVNSHKVETVEDETEPDSTDAIISEAISSSEKPENTSVGSSTIDHKKDKASTGLTKTKKIIICVAIIAAIVIGAIVLNENLSIERVRKDLPGEWVYDSSYTKDSENSYDAKLDSTISFTEDGEVVIQIDNCKCKGTWSVSKDGEYYYVFVRDYEISGKSKDMQKIIDSLTYREFSDGVNLYWYVNNDTETTNWHYYRHK